MIILNCTANSLTKVSRTDVYKRQECGESLSSAVPEEAPVTEAQRELSLIHISFQPAFYAPDVLLSVRLLHPRRKFQNRDNLQHSPYSITHLHCIIHTLSVECCYMRVN